MKTLLIGSTGLIGTVLQQQRNFDCAVHRSNIDNIVDQQFDFAVCAAPSSNRLLAQQNPQLDLDNVQLLCNRLTAARIDRIVLISSCDTQVKPQSVYGSNRLILENCVKNNFKQYNIIRLPALIHPSIKKNILYDLKHEMFLDKINLCVFNQWYPLSELWHSIDSVVQLDARETNLCSEPIENQEIVKKFFPKLESKIAPGKPDVGYNLMPYSHSREQIFHAMKGYFQ